MAATSLVVQEESSKQRGRGWSPSAHDAAHLCSSTSLELPARNLPGRRFLTRRCLHGAYVRAGRVVPGGHGAGLAAPAPEPGFAPPGAAGVVGGAGAVAGCRGLQLPLGPGVLSPQPRHSPRVSVRSRQETRRRHGAHGARLARTRPRLAQAQPFLLLFLVAKLGWKKREDLPWNQAKSSRC